MVRVTKVAIRTDRDPVVWKRASGVVIRKPGKEDNTKLNTYRSIPVLGCTGMVV
jgi:hypothetical protein